MDRNRTQDGSRPRSQEGQLTGSGAYRLGTRLGQSPSATVFSAQAVADGTAVVVKQPKTDGAAEHEASVLRRLNGDGAPSLLTTDTVDGHSALVIERLTGRSLLELVHENADLAHTDRFRRILDGLAAALAGLHSRGVVHGDLKPDHVVVGEDEAVRLLDFSASFLDGRRDPDDAEAGWLSPGFAAPEQEIAGAPIVGRSDIYAFGAVAFWAATGRLPPSAGDSGRAQAIESALQEAGLADDLRAVVSACLSTRPEERPADAAVLRERFAGRATVEADWEAPPRAEADELPPTVRVRRRRIVAAQPVEDTATAHRPRRYWHAARVARWSLAFIVLAGIAAAGVWQGRPLYEKHVKTEWLIDGSGAGDATSLAAAAARAGGDVTFLLAPGEYQGATLENGAYRIRAADPSADAPVILAGPEGCLVAVGARLDLAGLIFRGADSVGDRPCIQQTGGALRLTKIVVEDLAGPGIVLRGGAIGMLGEGELVSIGGDAIRVEGGSRLDLRETKIVGSGGNALVVGGGARLTMAQNIIADSGQTGILLRQGARAILEFDVIEGSGASGLEATSGARVDARELTLTGARGAGLFLHGESRILLRNSRVTNNGLSGIFVDSTERVEVRDSTIAENGEHGVVLLRAPAGRLERNAIGSNKGYGVVVDPATTVELGENVMESNGTGPIMDAREPKDGDKKDARKKSGDEKK